MLTTLDFDFDSGTLLYKGRNEVRRFDAHGQSIVVKRFRHRPLLLRIVESIFRKSKARRAYENALHIEEHGFSTPHPLGYVENRRCAVVGTTYYICCHTDSEAIRHRLIEHEPFDRQLATAYARFVARLHQAGVLHRDLNPTNVLFKASADGNYSFELIDTNRMRFYDGPVPKKQCMENLTLFWWLTPVYRYVLEEYARQRQWTPDDIDEAIRVKQRHDRRWVLRKRITHPLRK